MNCPECGHFMALEHADPPRHIEDGAAFEWQCNNDDSCWQSTTPIQDHAYDWLAWGISRKEMAELRIEDLGTWAAFEAMHQAYLIRGKR